MNSRKLKIAGSCLVTMILTLVLLSLASNLLQSKYSKKKYHDFFKEKNDIDVLYLGSSHVIDGISPMDMWHDHGIVSYNLGCHSNTIPTSYWVLRNALDYTTPKVVVVDGFLLSSSYKISGDNYSSVHKSFDAFPLTMTKIRGILDLMDDPNVEKAVQNGSIEIQEQRTPLGLLWDYSVYHSRWNELTEDDFSPAPKKNKGAEDLLSIYPLEVPGDNTVAEINGYGKEYLDKIVDLCNQNGIQVLLTYLPTRTAGHPAANWMVEYARENNLNCINFMDSNIIDPSIDFSDKLGHLNPSGAKKVSDYLADYLLDHYDVTSQKDNPAYAHWYDDYEEYVAYKLGLLSSVNRADLYLMLLNDTSFECTMVCSNAFHQKYNAQINNISCLGKISVSDVEKLEQNDTVGAVPDASIEITYNQKAVDKVYIYKNKVYRESIPLS